MKRSVSIENQKNYTVVAEVEAYCSHCSRGRVNPLGNEMFWVWESQLTSWNCMLKSPINK